MVIRAATLAMLCIVLSGWTAPQDRTLRFAEDTASSNEGVDPASLAAREMTIGCYYMDKHEYTAAINRFKTIIRQYPTSALVEEALTRLSQAYLAIGIASEAQTAVAVLARKFPDGRWSHMARQILRASGLEPAENEGSWIVAAVK